MAKKLAAPVLSRRQLGRATLARQMLLDRQPVTPREALERLVALQAQLARPPFIALWSRVAEFRREDLIGLLESRSAVRATMMRCTLFMLGAGDYLAFRTAMQPALTGALRGVLKDRASGFDVERLVERGRTFFGEEPRTMDEFRAFLLAQDPGADERALAYTVRTQLPLIQVPDSSGWGYPAAADFTPAEAWLGEAPVLDDHIADFVLRYLAACGPASVADIQNWTGLTGLKEVVERLRPQLATFSDERGRELFDLPQAPRPDAEVPAPVRFLPEFDNAVMAHADRTRILADEHRSRIFKVNLRVLPTVLVDGMVAGSWSIERKKKVATLAIEPFEDLPPLLLDELAAEGERLVRFVEPDAPEVAIRFT